ncbi:MAG: flippase-like domain-containing protein [Burkholderiales bacterium]|nr:flippase-like domain-containing protein [Burkholderiales bacterium]
MNPMLWRVVLGTVIAVALLALVLWGLDLQALGRTLAQARPEPLVAAVAVTVLAYWLRAWRWQALLAPVLRVPVAELHRATLVGFAASLAVPRSGEFLRPWLVARRHPVAASAGFATIVVERVVDLNCVLAMLALYLFVLPRPAMEIHGRWLDALGTAGLAAALVAVLLLATLWGLHAYGDALGRRLAGVGRRLPAWLAERAGGVARAFTEGLAVLRAPLRQHALLALQSALMWAATIAAYHFVHRALGIDLPPQVTLLLTAFLVVGEAIPTPGLIGGFHAFYVLVLVEIYGVDRQSATAAAIAAHALTNLPVLVGGAWLVARGDVGLKRLAQAARSHPEA